MAKFMFLYNGPATPPEAMTEEARNAEMGKWMAWMESLGPAMVEMGNPMANGAAVVDDGSAGTASLLSGYSIVEAPDMDGAKKFAKDHPFLADKSGKFKIEIFELIQMSS
jgi:hypothetical protein